MAKKVRTWRLLLWIALLLVALSRVAAIFVLRTYKGDAGAFEHAEIATHLANGEGFLFNFYNIHAVASSHQAPAVPFILAGCFKIAGMGTAAYLLAELFNVGLSLMAAFGLYWVGSMLWTARTGLIAVVGFAIYPPLIYAVTRVQAVNWTLAFLIVGIACVLKAIQTRSQTWACLSGLALGIGILGEPILLAPAVVAIVFFGVRVRWRAAMLMACMLLLTLTPWTVRNVLVHHRLMLVKSTFWYVFWQGNNPLASGTDKLLVSDEVAHHLLWRISPVGLEQYLEQARREAVSIDTTMSPKMMEAVRARATEVGKMEVFRAAAIKNLRNDPAHYVLLCAIRLKQFLWFDPTNPRSFTLAYRAPYILLAILALAGLFFSAFHFPRNGYVIVAMAIAIVLVHVMVITSARFRLPLEMLMLIPASFALTKLGGLCASRVPKSANPAALPA